jgi:uridine kinase
MWPKVAKGEDLYIFPYQEEADIMFNSALTYEFAVLKNYAEPMLRSVKCDEPNYSEELRLLNFLFHFIGVMPFEIPPTSIIREFIGGSSFEY